MTKHSNINHLKDRLAELVLKHYHQNKRTLPWRDTGNPYYTWLSEIMLQQTRVEAVKAYFLRFIEELPTVEALANCEEEKLLKLWEGLGYYTRVRNLQKAARQIMQEYSGVFPQTKQELLELAGIGDYTAAAIASIAFGQNEVALDGNLIRVFSRVFAMGDDFTKTAAKRELITKIEELLPPGVAGDFNQAIMDIGATICLPNGRPLCEKCPVAEMCKAYSEQSQMQYPFKKEKKARKIEKRTVFLICMGDEVIMRKRTEKGVLQGLWEFPNILGHLDKKKVREILTGELLLPAAWIVDIEEGSRATHIFSHLEWDMVSYWIELKEDIKSEQQWHVNEENSAYNVSKDSLPDESQEDSLRHYYLEEIEGIWLNAEDMKRNFSIPSAFKAFQKEFMDKHAFLE